jgi:uncharacterized protein
MGWSAHGLFWPAFMIKCKDMRFKHTRIRAYPYLTLLLLLSVVCGCNGKAQEVPVVPRTAEPPGFSKKISDAAIERLNHKVRYDPQYVKIPYPNGDVPANIGVCTDEVIRSYRVLGIDLQKDVHEEMTLNFKRFPNRWRLSKTDTNIDHRRVPNLQVLFAGKGDNLALTSNPNDYLPGDIVTWNVPINRPHIGIVVNRKLQGRDTYMIVHNIGAGPVLEDMLFKYSITGHYRYYGNLSKSGR